MDLTNREQLMQYMQHHGLYTKKGLGQNFLVDRSALEKIVGAAELSEDDCIIEVGPGLGVLTDELVGRAGKVIAVELDKTLAELLAERFSQNVISSHSSEKARNLRIDEAEGVTGVAADAVMGSPPRRQAGSRHLSVDRIPQDDSLENDAETIQQLSNLIILNSNILDINIGEIVEGCPSYKVVANIPYYITSKILRFFLETQVKPSTIVLLTQKEVAERVCAKPGDMSVLSISVQAYGDPEIVGIVPRTSFFPAPEVDSAILRIRIRNEELGITKETQKEFFRCVHIGFASRRKTLLNNLSSGYHMDKKTTLDILEKANLNDKTRAQELSIENWQMLCSHLTRTI